MRIFDVVFVVEANFKLVLLRLWKTNISRFKNVTVCFMTKFIVLSVSEKFLYISFIDKSGLRYRLIGAFLRL